MTARTLFELGALSALVAMTRGALWQCPADFDRLNPFHALRHTYAALLIAQGAHAKAVQAALGHSSIGVTFDVYGHLFPNLAEEQAVKLEDVRQSALGAGVVVPLAK